MKEITGARLGFLRGQLCSVRSGGLSVPVESDESTRQDEAEEERGVEQEGCGELETQTSCGEEQY